MPLTRGYSMFMPVGRASIEGASVMTNVLIKDRLPARGIVSSNPLRVERLLQKGEETGLIRNVKEHTNAGWGIKISTITFKDVEMFVAVIPMGSTGSGFAFFEMYAAGAQAIIRYGANDATDTHRELVVVECADNLVGLQHAAGDLDACRSDILRASPDLVQLLSEKAAVKTMPIKHMICHNVEDFHAYNFSEFFEDGDLIRKRIEKLKRNSQLDCCFDMETASLFLRANQFGLHATSVLLPAKSSLEIETDHFGVIFEALLDFSPHGVPEISVGSKKNSMCRLSRKYSTNDLIGVEEPLFYEDVETGNNMFSVDDDEALVF